MTIQITITLILLLTLPTKLNAQYQEIGLRTSGNSYNFIYKHGTSGSLTRYSLAFTNFQLLRDNRILSNLSRTVNNFSVGIGLGQERRKPINERFSFIHGPSGSLIYLRSSTRIQGVQAPQTTENLTLSIGYILGFQFNFSESSYINIETVPSIMATFLLGTNLDNFVDLNVGFNSNALFVTLAYRFERKKNETKSKPKDL